MLYNLRSAHNTASCFRTADGAGVKKLYLAGTTPAPVDRFGDARADFAKVALGAEKSVKYEKVADVFELIKRLEGRGFLIAAVEQDGRAESLFEFIKTANKVALRQAQGIRKLALIFGNEVEGVPEEILKKCDKILEIPMRGEKESLNVAVAFGIVAFHIIYD